MQHYACYELCQVYKLRIGITPVIKRGMEPSKGTESRERDKERKMEPGAREEWSREQERNGAESKRGMELIAREGWSQ